MRFKPFVYLGLLLALISPMRVMAQPQEIKAQIPVAFQVDGTRATFSFEQLGYGAINLTSPVATTRIRFSMPPGWRLLPGGEIELHYELLVTGADANTTTDNRSLYGANLILRLNDKIVGTVPLGQIGDNTIRLQLPPDSLVSTEKDGSHLLSITFSAQFSCQTNINALVTIAPSSFFDLPYEASTPTLNLSNLPAPFYLSNSFIPDNTLVVIPDDPSTLNVQAALDVMSGFGSMIGGTYDMKIITQSQLTQANRSSSHIIFVGTPSQLGILSDIKFPVPVLNGQFVGMQPGADQDGIIQLALSPWNPNKVVMMAGGISDEAVLKAAEAVSAGSVFVYQNPAIAYVSAIQSLSETIPVVQDFSLQNLGYTTRTLSGIGVFSTEYSFNVSQEQVSSADGYLDLVYYHSGMLEYGSSTMSVDINRQVITSAVFHKETEQVTTLRVKIPPGILRFGENLLRVTASMPYSQSCDSSGLSNPWLIVSEQSRFHLPASAVDSSSAPLLVDLSFYPDLFTTHSDLGDTAFVLPKSDAISLDIAGKLAYDLGSTAKPRISNLSAVYADNVPQDLRSTHSMIVVGRSSTLPFLSELNDSLPAPFDFKADTASERQMQIIYRIPDGVNVGYLELISSPFNAEKSILIISGNNEKGLALAGDVPLQSDLSSQLAGTFAVTNGTQVATGNGSSLSSIVGLIVPDAEAVVTTPVPTEVAATPAEATLPVWLIPVLMTSGIVIVIIMGFIIRSAILSGRNRALEQIDEDNIDTNPEEEAGEEE